MVCFAQTVFAKNSQNPLDANLLQEFKAKNKTQNALSKTQINTFSARPFSLKSQWEVLPQVSVNPNTAQTIDENSNNVGNFKLKTNSSLSTEKQFNKSSPMVLRSKRSQNLGVLTGTFIVKLKSPQDDIAGVLLDYDLMLLQPFKHLSLYFVTSKNNVFNLESTYELLSKDPRIQSLDIEIISRTYGKK